MNEKPILFNSEMIEAILDGRKTQTRRILRLDDFQRAETPGYDWMFRDKRSLWNEVTNERLLEKYATKYKAGDKLWVRETWRIVGWHEGEPYYLEYKDGVRMDEPGYSGYYDEDKYLQYFIDCTDDMQKAGVPFNADTELYDCESFGSIPTRWRPSIYMPRWASRITLHVTDVRVERVRDIDNKNALIEGVKPFPLWSPRESFAALWDSINLKRGFGWETNPWVWVVDFKAAPLQ